MCGIVAAFAYRPDAAPLDRRGLIAARDRMAERGPDDAGDWSTGDGRVWLGHRRLAVIDTSVAGHQPMRHPVRDIHITYNGEIYNYRELRRELEQAGETCITGTDTEVILRLYARHGVECLGRLRGMFAFALWDGERRGMLLARDPFGIKPLYVSDDGRTLLAASQVRALRQLLPDASSDPAGHLGFFVLGWVPDPLTPFREIRSVPAGSWSWRSGDGRIDGRYYDVCAAIADAEERGAVAAGNGATLARALEDSVAHHLIADVPVIAYLSSGIDSTAIATVASRLAGGGLRALTLQAAEQIGTAGDETPLASAVARELSLEHTSLRVGAEDLADRLDPIVDAMDQPTIDGLNSYFVSRAAAGLGVKVALSGLGGDELFAGYPGFRQIPALVRAVSRLPAASTIGRGLRRSLAPLIGRLTSPKYASLIEYGGDFPGAYLLRRALHLPWEMAPAWDPVQHATACAGLSEVLAGPPGLQDIRAPTLKITALETTMYMAGQLLRDADWAGMAWSVEIRTPLVDVEFYRQLLPLLASRTPPRKRDLVAAARPPLLEQIAARPKTGFELPIRQWLAGSDTIRSRGLRGWSRVVYDKWCSRHGAAPLVS